MSNNSKNGKTEAIDKKICIRISLSEREKMKKNAQKLGLTVTDFIKKATNFYVKNREKCL